MAIQKIKTFEAIAIALIGALFGFITTIIVQGSSKESSIASENRMRDLESQNTKLTLDNNKLEGNLSERKTRVNQLSSELKTTKINLENNKSELAILQTQFDDLNSQIDDLKNEVITSTTRYRDINEQTLSDCKNKVNTVFDKLSVEKLSSISPSEPPTVFARSSGISLISVSCIVEKNLLFYSVSSRLDTDGDFEKLEKELLKFFK